MQAAASLDVVVAVKDAEINMLRQQLAQLSSDLSRNLAVMAVKEAEADDAGNAVGSLTAVLAEKDALFAQYEEQVAALEALRQKEAAECNTLQAALDSQKQHWQQQLQAEQAKREALEQQLKRSEEASAAQLQSARQAAVTQAVQHSSQYQTDLDRAAGQRKQLQQQVQELEAALAGKESELASVQMQLAAALESTKRVQDNHGKSMASKTALVTQMGLELDQVKAAHSQANKAHEGHIGQLIASINEMQELCTKQAAELQQYAAGQKAQQEELRALRKATKQHEEARSKAEMRKSAMESALQHEVTAHAAVRAHHGLLQECLNNLVANLQQQHTGAAEGVAQLSAQLSEAQQQMVCAAVSSQHATPERSQKARMLEDQYQGLSTQLLAAQERESCLKAICQQLQHQVVSLLPPTSPSKQAAQGAGSPVKAPAVPGMQPYSCMAALTQSLQQQQQQQRQQHRQQQAQAQQQQAQAQQQQVQQQQAPAPVQHQQAPMQHHYPQHHQHHQPQAQTEFGQTAAPLCQPSHAYQSCAGGCCTAPSAQQAWGTPSKQAQPQQHWQSLASPQGYAPAGAYSPGRPDAAAVGSAPAASPLALPGSMAGMMGQLQAGVARLQQQLCANQQEVLQRMQPQGAHVHRGMADSPVAHMTCSFGAASPGMLDADYHHQQQQQQQQAPLAHQQQPGWQQHHQPPHKSHAAGLQCADNMQHEQWQGLHCTGLAAPGSHQHILQQQQQQLRQHHHQEQQQRWDADDDEDLDSICGRTADDCCSDISTLSCSAEVAAALAAARHRMGHNSTPTGSRHAAKAAAAQWKSPAIRKGAHAKAARQLSAAAATAKGCNAANLTALATATLKKLELLSAESPTKQWG